MHLVLIHGMGRTSMSMLFLRRCLKKLGHKPYLFGYFPMFESLEDATHRLTKFINRKIGNNSYVIVGHSLGSVIIRNTLSRLDQDQLSACFFLAPPVTACKTAKFFSRFWLYRIFSGNMGQLLAQESFMQQLPLHRNTRIYVGTSGPKASWLPFRHEPNDCILSFSEATGNLKATIVKVPSIHTFIMNSRVVINDMANCLKSLG